MPRVRKPKTGSATWSVEGEDAPKAGKSASALTSPPTWNNRNVARRPKRSQSGPKDKQSQPAAGGDQEHAEHFFAFQGRVELAFA